MNLPTKAKTNWFGLVKKSFADWSEDKALRLSAALAYYSAFSIAPLLVITIGIAGLVLGREAVTGQLHAEIKNYVGNQAAEGIQSMVQGASKPTHGVVATIVGFVTLLLGASGVFGELKDALNTIWEVRPKAGAGFMGLIRNKFLNFGMVLVIGFLLLVSLVLSSAIAALNHRLESVLALPAVVWAAIAFLVSFGMVTMLFALIFKVLPDARIQWRDVWIGAAITAILFEIGKTGLSWYLGRESTAHAYGAAGSVVLLLLWVYYTSCILFFGAEFTQVHAQARGRRIEPAANAESVTAGDKTLQGLRPASESFELGPAGFVPVPVGGPERPAFSHKLLSPILTYLEGRGLLLSIEAKEALWQSIGLLLVAVICCVAIFAGWLLLATALVGLLTKFIGWFWVKSAAIAGGAHVLCAAILAWIVWRRLKQTTWFAETIKELKNDRTWLRGETMRN